VTRYDRGRFVLLAGEPGIGKTRLAERVGGSATACGAQVISGRCWEGAPAFWPWVQVLRACLRTSDGRTLASRLGPGGPYVAQVVVSREKWEAALEKLRVKEKQATRARDALAAERRRLPMVRIEKEYVFEGRDGKASLVDLFEGRRQLILYHFMFGPNQEAGCDGCSMFVDQIGHLAHLHARDTPFALVSRAPIARIEAYRKRMGWTIRGSPRLRAPSTTPLASAPSVLERASIRTASRSA
jgi:hypothetical protein